MKYAQIKKGKKMHIVITYEDSVSLPLCGIKNFTEYRMTINVPLGITCKRCLKIYKTNNGIKRAYQFLNAIMQEAVK